MCLDVSNGRFNPRQSKYKIPEKLSISREKVTKISDFIFMVESEKNSDQIYSVDMQSGVCSCMKGRILKMASTGWPGCLVLKQGAVNQLF